MKTMALKLVFFLLLIVLATGCSKDQSTEFFSSGEWKLLKYYYGGVDNTDSYITNHENYRLTLKLDKHFTETQILNDEVYNVEGVWEVSDNALTLRLYDDLNGTREFEVHEATISSLVIEKGAEEFWFKRP